MPALTTAKEYFRLSNSRDMEGIADLFADDATYSSDNTGLFFGKKDIMGMVVNFFNSFPELSWVVHSIEERTPYIVELNFTCLAKDEKGASTERQGVESLIIRDGKIRHVEVRNR